MKKEPGNITDELLAKYLLGEATETEQQQVAAWLAASKDNKKYYNDIAALWSASASIATPPAPDADAAWARFRQRTQVPKQVISIASGKSYNWLKIAALLVLLAGGGITFYLSGNKATVVAKNTTLPVKKIGTVTSNKTTQLAVNEQVKQQNEIKITDNNRHILATTVIKPKKKTGIDTYNKAIAEHSTKIARENAESIKTKGYICNGTPCPIEICITQTIKCNHGQPSTVSTCSTLEPDESGRLHYQTHDKLGKHCTLSIDEITIKTVSTGETIVLNSNSKPSTAQDFFKYITRQKKGDIVAGVFHDDCDNNENCGLKFNNNFGDLILQ